MAKKLINFLKFISLFGVCVSFCLFLMLAYAPRLPLLQGVDFGKVVLDRDGKLMRITASADQKYRLRQNIDNIAPEMIRETLLYEDRYFFVHPGINPGAFARALASMGLGSRKLGASTITMQTARLRYKLKTSNIAGKLAQIWKALQLERHYSKTEILEAYFSLAPYGGNIEGIEAASRIYFRQPAYALTSRECEALAKIPQNPVARNPVKKRNFEAALKKQKNGNTPIRIKKADSLPFMAPHLVTELVNREKANVIETTIDSQAQNFLEARIRGMIEKGRRFAVHNACALIVDWRTMETIALAGSANFSDAGIMGQVDGTRALRSPGSTLKPFIYGLALDQGLVHPQSVLIDNPKSFGGYDPQNFEGDFRGPVPAHIALKDSRNLPAITLAEKLANPDLYDFLAKADITFPRGRGHYGLALALGGAETSMRKLAALYCALANQGLYRPLVVRKGSKKPAAKRLLSPEAAWLVMEMLSREDVFVSSGARRIPLLYKTGTSNGFRDAWTFGICGQYVIGVWVGNFDNTPNPLFIGAETALPLFTEIAQGLAKISQLINPLEKQPKNLQKTDVCLTTGDFEIAHCPQKGETWIIPGVTNTRSQNIIRPVLVDKASGLRVCDKKKFDTEERWYEFWPSDTQKIFSQAGIYKEAPPPLHPSCQNSAQAIAKTSILSPKKNVAYRKSLSEKIFILPLQGSADADVKKIFWFADKELIGESVPGETIFWETSRTGKILITAVNDSGASLSQYCEIDLVP